MSLAMAALVAGTAVAAEPEPYMLARSLEALQNQAAIGTLDNSRAQRQLLLRIGERFEAADPSVWADPRNARAGVVYVLAGGQPQFLRRMLVLTPPPLQQELIAGALAYASGRRDVAAEMLDGIEAAGLPPSLGGHLALAQGTLAMESDPARAAQLLRQARLMMPGTLVAEAALRREIAATSALDDMSGFGDLVERYFRRFGRSVYAPQMLERLAPLWLEIKPGEADDVPAELERLTAAVPAAKRRGFLLSVARLALVQGQMLVANQAAASAAATSPTGSRSALRSELYAAATAVTGDAHAGAVEALRKLDEVPLPPPDRALQQAALAVASQLRAAASQNPSAESPERREKPPLIARAEGVLKETEALLRRAEE